MARAAGSDVLVGWMSLTAPRIANDRGDDTIQGVKRRLQAPEAATGKCRFGEVVTIRHGLHLMVERFPKVCATVCNWCLEGGRSAARHQPANPFSSWLPSQKGLLVE